jgi:Transglutaminase-like superfamily
MFMNSFTSSRRRSSSSPLSPPAAGGQPPSRYAVSLLGAVAVAAVAPLLARLDLQRLQRCLEPSPRSSRSPSVDPGQLVEGVGRRVDQVIRWGRPVVRPGCLTRGIAGYYILRRAGLDVALCFGIGSIRGAAVVGHCWLVLDGKPVLEAVDPRPVFTELVRLSSRGLTSANPAS